MRKLFTLLFTVLFASGIFAATEPAWYNDVTSISANGQYYIYSVNGKGFMQAGQSQVKSITTSNYTNASTFYFKIANPSEGTVTCGSYYLKCYREVSGTSSGPLVTSTGNGTNIIFTSMNNGEYWNIHAHYNVFGERYPALFYKDNKYDGYIASGSILNGGYSITKDTQTGTEYRWYVISQAQLDRHFAIYFFDAYKEGCNLAQYENQVPAAYYAALQTAYNKSFNVQNTAHTAEVVNAAKADLQALYSGAEAVKAAYNTAKGAINALEAVEDKGEDATEVTAGISNARTAIEQAMSVDALNAAVSAPALKAIDPITFTVTEFTALETLGTPASTVAGRTITYDAADKTIINAAGQPIHKGTTTLTATAAATNDYYKFVRSAQVTVNALPTSAEENKTITYGAEETWNGYDLSTYMVGSHSLVYETTNAQGGVHTITLNLTVNKIETLNVPVELNFCAGGSEMYRGTEYTEAGTYAVPAEGATRDTVYNVTVTVLQPSFGEETLTITYGDATEWNGIALGDSIVGVHEVVYYTANVAGCDSIATLTLTVNKQETLNVPVELAFCAGGSEMYRGTEYTEAGTYAVPAEGATRDTVYNVIVTVLQPSFGEETLTITYGDAAEWNGIALGDSTIGVHEVVYYTANVAGCDSIATLTLTVNKQETLNVPVELAFCAGGSEMYRGTEYTEAGTYAVPAEGATRDTVYNVTVTVLQPSFGEETLTITYGDAAEWNGIALGDSIVGVHSVVYKTANVAGCDSTATLTLTVNKQETLNVPVELAFCAGGSEMYRGTEYTEAGSYNVPAEGATRDTVYNVTVTVLQPTFGTDTKTIVYGAQETWNGIDLSEQTVGQHEIPFTTTNAAGCDSTVTLALTVNKLETLNVPVELSFCPGGSETYRGTEYTEAGSYNVPAEGAARDTVYNVTVTVLQPTFGTDTKTIVYGAQETWNGIHLGDSTVGQHMVVYETVNAAGCDSTVTLTLTVTKQNVVEIPVDFTFCEGDSAEFRGTYYKETGLYPVYVAGEVSDTVYNVAVTVNQPTSETAEMTIVYGDAAEWNGYDLSTYMVGKYELPYNTQNMAGCDSVITLSLTVNKLDALILETVVLGFCEGDSVEYRGKWYFESALDTIYAEGEVRDTVIYVEAVVLPIPEPIILMDTVLSGHEIILPEGEWVIGEETVSGTYPTIQSAETAELVFTQYNEEYEGCGDPFIYLVVTVESNHEAVENVFVGGKAEKFFRNGVLYIRRGERNYVVDGRLVR